MAIGLTSLNRPTTVNPAGTRLLLSVALLSDLTTIRKPAGDAGSDNADLVNITSDHVFASGKFFHKLELEINKNELNATMQGAVVGAAHLFEFTGFLPNLTKAQQGLLQLLSRNHLLVLVHLADNQVLQLGEENNGAMFQYNPQTGLQEGGERGNVITVRSFQHLQFYSGAIAYS